MKLSPIILATAAVSFGAAVYLRNLRAPEAAGEHISGTSSLSAGQASPPLPGGLKTLTDVETAVQSPEPAIRHEPVQFAGKTASVVMETAGQPAAQGVTSAVSEIAAVNSVPANEEHNGYASLELAQQMEGIERIQMVRQGIIQIASVNVTRAVEVANALTDEHDHGVAVGSLVRITNEKHPALAASIAFSQVPPQTTLGLLQYPRTAVVMKQILDTQISESPARAVHWADSFPDASNQEAARKLVAVSWAERSPEAALQWVQTLPESNRHSVRSAIETTLAPP